MQVLTKFQERLLKEISLISEFKENFFLTGGTALSAFYIKHRYSDDLDFFTEIPLAVQRVLPLFKELVKKLEARLEIHRSFKTFIEATVTNNNEIIRIHFAEDIPYRLNPTIFNRNYGIYVDNVIDISCNKFSALFERHEMKDFVDIYFIDKEVIKFEELYLASQKKHIGLDDYYLVQALRYINEISILPRMIKDVTVDKMRSFFNQKTSALMSRMKNNE